MSNYTVTPEHRSHRYTGVDMHNREHPTMPSILIFEHVPDNNQNVHSWIKKRGNEVVGRVHSEEDALMILKGSAPDLVVVISPSTGFEDLTAAAGKIAAGFGIPLVFIPAGADEGLLNRVFPEPVSTAGLLELDEVSGQTNQGQPELSLLKSQIEEAHRALSREIKRRREAESAWRKGEIQLSSLIKGSPLAVELYNSDGQRGGRQPSRERPFGRPYRTVSGIQYPDGRKD